MKNNENKIQYIVRNQSVGLEHSSSSVTEYNLNREN